MKILMVNKFYYVKGGSETYLFALKNTLESRNHSVIPFSMKDEKNKKSEYSDYFIENIDYNEKNIFRKIKYASKIIYNFDAAERIKRILEDVKPDIVHLHLFQHQISPSILKVIKEKGIPIVYTVHDLKPVCLNYKMLNKKGICEECKGGKYFNCLKNKCVKDSYSLSFINVIEGYLHNKIGSYNLVDKFITPSEFYKKKLLGDGYPQEKVTHINNFIEIENFTPNYDNDDYFVYIGRLSEEKGIKTLIKAMNNVKQSKLKIIGTGPIEEELREFVKLNNIKNIEFVGFKNQNELKKLVSNSKFVVITSEWYENGPMSVLEAMALGKPIIGSNIGGIPEMVEDKKNGYLYKSGDYIELSDKINNLLNNEQLIECFGKESRKLVENKYNENIHYDQIIEIYKALLVDQKNIDKY